jgi:hypothetical protein
MEAQVSHKREVMRRIVYVLASLMAFAMAVGAGWKPLK